MYESIDYKVEVNIDVDSDVWTIEPNTVTFIEGDAEQKIFFFSQDVYEALKSGYTELKAEKLEDEYLNTVQEEYNKGVKEVEEEEEEAEKNAEEAYNKKIAEIEEGEGEGEGEGEREGEGEGEGEKEGEGDQNNENQSGGSKYLYLNKFRNRTHKLK